MADAILAFISTVPPGVVFAVYIGCGAMVLVGIAIYLNARL